MYLKKLYMFFLKKLNSPLMENSIFLILTNIINAGIGYIFWYVAAKLFFTENVGIATALISYITLFVIISKIGMDYSMVKYIHNYDRNTIFSTTINISILISLIISIIAILLQYFVGIELFFTNVLYYLLFIIFIIVDVVLFCVYQMFISIRKSKYQFYISIITLIKIPLLFLFSSYQYMGILCAFGFSFVIALIIAPYFLSKENIVYKCNTLDINYLYISLKYSLKNYVSNIFILAPNMILPILVLNVLGPSQAAFYYIAYSIVSLLITIPNSTSTSLFVEGCHGGKLKRNIIKSVIFIFSLLFILGITIIIFGNTLLNTFGEQYAIGTYKLLIIMVISTFFYSIHNIYFSLKRVLNKLNDIIIINGIIFISLLCSSYIFMKYYGIIGIGYGWIFSYCIGAIYAIISILHNYYPNTLHFFSPVYIIKRRKE